MRRADHVVGLLALLTASCGGATGEAPSHAPREATASSASAVSAAPVPLRRLSREEYNNSVRDLLADRSRPADAFPPDESVSGFESNSIAPVTTPLIERYLDAAEGLASSAVKRLDTVAPCPAGHAEDACAKSFIDGFGRLAFRRPLRDEERASLLRVYSEKASRSGYAGGIQLVIEVILESPQFLYRVEPADARGSATRALSGYELATRLSFFLWASTPDAALLDDAAAGHLDTPAGVAKIARRMLEDPRAVDGVRSFHRQWLGLTELDTASKEASFAQKFTPELKSAMVEETLRFGASAVFGGGDTVRTLLTSNRSFVNALLAKHYGLSISGDGFAPVELPREQRSGLLTQASVLTVLSGADQTSPILRGKFVREKFLCQPIPPPPPGVVITPPKVDPTRTTKERFVQHRRDPSCAGCHQLMDPIGFGFEHYDALGGWRTVDGAFPVDAIGELSGLGDSDGAFDGAVQLGQRLAASPAVRRCVATQWFRFALGRGERDEDEASLDAASRAFERSGFDARELIVAITTTDAFRHTKQDEGSKP